MAVAATEVEVAWVPVPKLVEAVAIIFTVPAAPETQVANPDCVMVATVELELNQVPVYGVTKETGAGDGALLNVPIAANYTCPCAED